MLSSFSLRNFRTFEERTEFDLSPLTVLVGPNSSGKSSLMKALMLLKESCIRTDLTELEFAGGGHKLGSFGDIVSRRSNNESIEFGFEFSYEVNNDSQFLNSDSRFIDGRKVWIVLKFNQRKHVSTCFGIDRGQGFEALVEIMVPHPDAECFDYSGAMVKSGRLESSDLFCWEPEQQKSTTGLYVNGPLIMDLIYETKTNLDVDIDLELLPKELNNEYTIIDARYHKSILSDLGSNSARSSNSGEFFDHTLFFPSDFDKPTFEHKHVIQKSKFIRDNLKELSIFCIDKLRHFLRAKNLTNLSHLRSGSKQVYTEDSIPNSFAQILRRVIHDPFPEKWTATGELTPRHENIAMWLEDVGIGPRIEVEILGGSAYIIKIEDNDKMVPITNVGYGISQLVPLILYLAYPDKSGGSNSGSTFFLEEPEANLHPNFQARIADLLVKGLLRSSRAIVETHSEYLIRRLQLLVARGEASTKDITIYYLGPDPSAEDYIRRITIDEHGQLSQPFGPGFFDEATNLMMDLFKHGRKN